MPSSAGRRRPPISWMHAATIIETLRGDCDEDEPLFARQHVGGALGGLLFGFDTAVISGTTDWL